MSLFDAILPTAVLFWPTLVALLVCAGLLLLADFLLLRRLRGSGDERRFGRQILMLVLTLVAAIVVILVLPISEAKGPEADALRRDLEAREREAERLQEELAQPAREPTPV